MTWQFLIYLSSGTVDLCSYLGKSLVREPSIKIEDGGFDKDLQPTRGTAGWEVAYSPALLSALLAQTARPRIEIKKDGVFVFTGLLRPTDDFSLSNALDSFPMEAVDLSDLLDQRTGTALSFPGVVARTAGGSDSALHQVVSLLTTAVTVLCDNNLVALPNFACDATEPVIDVLVGLLTEHGMTMRFDEQGRLVVRNLPSATSVATFGDQAGNLDIDNGTFRMRRVDAVEDSVELTYQQIGNKQQALRCNAQVSWPLVRNTPFVDSDPVSFTVLLDALTDSGARFTGQSNWSCYATGRTRNIVTDPWIQFTDEAVSLPGVGGTYVKMGVFTPAFSGAQFSLILDAFGLKYREIQNFKLVADYTYSFPGKTAKAFGPGAVYKKVTARFLFDDTSAQALASLLQSRLGGGGYSFAWASPSARSIGEIVTLNVSRDGVSAIALITSRSWNRATLRYDYEGTKYSTITVTPTTVPDVDVSDPVVFQIEADTSVIARRADGTANPDAVVFTASQSQTPGGVAPYLGVIRVHETADGSTWTVVATSAPGSRTYSWTPSLTAKAIKAELFSDYGDLLRECQVLVSSAPPSAPSAGYLRSLIQFDDLPVMPDGAGTAYAQDAWATVDGWSSANGTLSVSTPSTGMLTYTNTANNPNLYSKIQGASISGKTVVLSIAKRSGAVNIGTNFAYVRVGAGGAVGTLSNSAALSAQFAAAPVDVFQLYSFVVPSDANAYTCFRIDLVTTSIGQLYSIDWVYIGDGSYLSPALDSSGNGNTLTLTGGIRTTGRTGYGLLAPRGTLTLAGLTTALWGSAWVTLVSGTIPLMIFESSTSINVVTSGTVNLMLNSTVNGRLTLTYRTAPGATVTGYIDSALPALGFANVQWVFDKTKPGNDAIKLYVAGVLQALTYTATDATRPTLYNGPAFVGVRGLDGTLGYTGSIDEVRIERPGCRWTRKSCGWPTTRGWHQVPRSKPRESTPTVFLLPCKPRSTGQSRFMTAPQTRQFPGLHNKKKIQSEIFGVSTRLPPGLPGRDPRGPRYPTPRHRP